MPARPEDLTRYAEEFNNSRGLKHFGVVLSFPEGKRVEVRLDPIRPEHRGGLGSTEAVNGGILAALFDLAIGCTPALIDPKRRSATMQLSMSFERPVTGRALTVVAEIGTAGQSVVFSNARVLDEQGAVCARCQGVVRFSKIPWAKGGSPAVD